VKLGDSVTTTDHFSPAGARPVSTAAREYLTAVGVERFQLSIYASGRGNHEVEHRAVRGERPPPQPARARRRGIDSQPPGLGDLTVFDPARRTARAACQCWCWVTRTTAADRHATVPPRRQGGPRGVLRAHPPLQPHRNGHLALAVHAWRLRRLARPAGRQRDIGIGGLDASNDGLHPATENRQRWGDHLRGPSAPRHGPGCRLLPSRRNPMARQAMVSRTDPTVTDGSPTVTLVEWSRSWFLACDARRPRAYSGRARVCT